jgi:hypothetical protein
MINNQVMQRLLNDSCLGRFLQARPLQWRQRFVSLVTPLQEPALLSM